MAEKKKKATTGLTKTELVSRLAAAAKIEKKQATLVLEGLADVVAKELKGAAGQLKIPGVAMIQIKHRPARPSRQGRNPKTGEAMTIAAKPAGRVIKARVPKALKDAVL